MMKKKLTPPPVFDLHCDLLSYLVRTPNADPMRSEDIGCAIPHLQKGNVKLQTMAIFTPEMPDGASQGIQQSEKFADLLTNYSTAFKPVRTADGGLDLEINEKTGIVAAIESASGFCNETDPLDTGLANLEIIIRNTGGLLYISMTHAYENRFGGDSGSDVGLKDDGKVLLDYLHGRKIAIDVSHASDPLAWDILEYVAQANLDVPVIASHSNFGEVWEHDRNLPEVIAGEIIDRGGIIGINFIRPFLNDHRPEALIDHILYGLDIGGENALAFGADFFYEKAIEMPPGETIFHECHRTASFFPSILEDIREYLSEEQLIKMAYRNVARFLWELWADDGR